LPEYHANTGIYLYTALFQSGDLDRRFLADLYLNRGNEKTYTLFFNEFVSIVTEKGGKTWADHLGYCGDNVDEATTVSDEAFTILALDNGWDQWMSMAETGDTMTPKERAQANLPPLSLQHPDRQYTGGKTNASTRHMDGWGAEGLGVYKEWCELVKSDREENGGEFNEYFKNCWKEKRDVEGNVVGAAKDKEDAIRQEELERGKRKASETLKNRRELGKRRLVLQRKLEGPDASDQDREEYRQIEEKIVGRPKVQPALPNVTMTNMGGVNSYTFSSASAV
jgi:hypothetical protein